MYEFPVAFYQQSSTMNEIRMEIQKDIVHVFLSLVFSYIRHSVFFLRFCNEIHANEKLFLHESCLLIEYSPVLILTKFLKVN